MRAVFHAGATHFPKAWPLADRGSVDGVGREDDELKRLGVERAAAA